MTGEDTHETSGILSALLLFPPAAPSLDVEGKLDRAEAEKGW